MRELEETQALVPAGGPVAGGDDAPQLPQVMCPGQGLEGGGRVVLATPPATWDIAGPVHYLQTSHQPLGRIRKTRLRGPHHAIEPIVGDPHDGAVGEGQHDGGIAQHQVLHKVICLTEGRHRRARGRMVQAALGMQCPPSPA